MKPGDIFVVQSPSFVSKAIMAVTEFWSLDGNSQYSHAGIITSESGDTFESRFRIGPGHISAYNGLPMMIGRHRLMSDSRFNRAFSKIKHLGGHRYPVWRIAFHLIPPIARCISTGEFLVCSELAMRFLYESNLVETYKGWNPDNLADMMEHYKLWDITFKRGLK